MAKDNEKKTQGRMLIAITLFFASIVTSFAIAFLSNQGSAYWVVQSPIPKGVQITRQDIEISKMKLSRMTDGYLVSSANPIGTITKRAFASGELLYRGALTNSSDQMTSETLSLSIRAVDIPASVLPGDSIAIYQLHDVRNGEAAVEPQLVLSSLFLTSVEGKKGNFSGEISVSVSLDRKEIPKLLAATTSGRLVIVATSG